MTQQEMERRQQDTVERQSRRASEITCETVYYTNEGISHAMDIYRPSRKDFPGKRPGILFFFGGGFALGCRHAFRQQAEICAEQGYIAATCDYRITAVHKTKAEDSFRDGAAAWRFFLDRGASMEMDPEKVFLSGGSAGAMIAYMSAWMSGSRPAGFIFFNPGVVDHEAKRDLSELTKDAVDGIPVLNVESFMEGTPPVLIMHGEKDHIIAKETIQRLTDYGKSHGVDVKLILYPEMDHGFYNFNRDRACFYMTIGETLNFLKQNS